MSSKPMEPAHRLALMGVVINQGPEDPTERIILTMMVTLARVHTDDETGQTSVQYRGGARMLARPFVMMSGPRTPPQEIGKTVDPAMDRLTEAGYITLLREGIPGKGRHPGEAAHWRINL